MSYISWKIPPSENNDTVDFSAGNLFIGKTTGCIVMSLNGIGVVNFRGVVLVQDKIDHKVGEILQLEKKDFLPYYGEVRLKYVDDKEEDYDYPG
jgi:hypothetical protein